MSNRVRRTAERIVNKIPDEPPHNVARCEWLIAGAATVACLMSWDLIRLAGGHAAMVETVGRPMHLVAVVGCVLVGKFALRSLWKPRHVPILDMGIRALVILGVMTFGLQLLVPSTQ